MKLPFLLVLACAGGPAAWAQTVAPVQVTETAETVASAQAPQAPRDASAHPRLRDSFQVPASRSDEPAKPYRLSSEERLRLREQVRGQFAFETPKP
jgi:hypothetical protein